MKKSRFDGKFWVRRVAHCALIFAIWLLASTCTARAQSSNPEDEAIPDAIPTLDATPENSAPEHHAADGHSPNVEEHATETAAELKSAPWWNVPASFAGEENAFLRRALWAALLVAALCGYLGVYVVLKRIVFVGVALAELSSAGIALALWWGLAPLLGSVGFTLLGLLLFSLRFAPRRLPQESVIGVVYAIAGALAILLIAKNPTGESQMLKLMQGDVLTVDSAETLQMLGAYLVAAILHLVFHKEFVLVSFDRDAASTLGLGARRWDFLLFLTIGIAIAFAIRAVGVLLTSTLLVMPGVTALMLCSQLKRVLLVAPLLAMMQVVLGLHLSYFLDVPASAATVALAFLFLICAALCQTARVRN